MNDLRQNDRLRYPIGPFEPVENSTPEQRHRWVEEIAELPKTHRLTVQNLTEKQRLTPYRPGGWNVQQIVHHIADNDMNAYIRFKRALTEDNPTANSYREHLWAELSDYRVTPIETSLILIDALHSRFADLLHSLHPVDFQKTFTSPAHGVMNLDVATQRFAWHNRHHIAQIASLSDRL